LEESSVSNTNCLSFFPILKKLGGTSKIPERSSVRVLATKIQTFKYNAKEEREIRLKVIESYYVDVSSLRKDVSNYRGGNIKNYFEEWEKISSDKFILEIIKFGLKLEFKSVIPNQKASLVCNLMLGKK